MEQMKYHRFVDKYVQIFVQELHNEYVLREIHYEHCMRLVPDGGTLTSVNEEGARTSDSGAFFSAAGAADDTFKAVTAGEDVLPRSARRTPPPPSPSPPAPSPPPAPPPSPPPSPPPPR